MKIEKDLENYIRSKLSKMKKQKTQFYYTHMIAKFTIMALNLVIIGLALWVLIMQIDLFIKLDKPNKSFLDEVGLTFVLALFIVLTFFVNLILSFYTAYMKFSDYKKAINEIEYITISLEEKPNYSEKQFSKDLEQIEKTYLAKKKVSKKNILVKFVMGEK